MAGRDSFPLNEFVAAVREDITAWCVAAIVSSALLLLVYSALPGHDPRGGQLKHRPGGCLLLHCCAD